MAQGDIKRFREHLNAEEAKFPTPKHQHGRYQQRKRKYGDYLYAQDREKFMVEMEEWLKSHAEPAKPKPVFEAIHLTALAIDEVQARGTERHAAALALLEEGRKLWRERSKRQCPKCGHRFE